jgi:N-acyl-D-aspartate/D-glutamate deacylase
MNVIDFDRLQPRRPEIVNDLPANGRRLMQRADGYVATVVSGCVAFRNGEPTGVLAGRLIRGAKSAPAEYGWFERR